MAGFNHIENDTVTGTVGGTLLAVFAQLEGTDVLRTVILASIGAVASFIVSRLTKWLWNWLKIVFKRNKY